MDHQHHLKDCMRTCQQCHDACEETLAHILERGGEHLDPRLIATLTDCIAICATSAGFLRRGSKLHVHTCRACAEICTACAEACEAMDEKHTTIQRCAETCRRCAEHCRDMSQMKYAA